MPAGTPAGDGEALSPVKRLARERAAKVAAAAAGDPPPMDGGNALAADRAGDSPPPLKAGSPSSPASIAGGRALAADGDAATAPAPEEGQNPCLGDTMFTLDVLNTFKTEGLAGYIDTHRATLIDGKQRGLGLYDSVKTEADRFRNSAASIALAQTCFVLLLKDYQALCYFSYWRWRPSNSEKKARDEMAAAIRIAGKVMPAATAIAASVCQRDKDSKFVYDLLRKNEFFKGDDNFDTDALIPKNDSHRRRLRKHLMLLLFHYNDLAEKQIEGLFLRTVGQLMCQLTDDDGALRTYLEAEDLKQKLINQKFEGLSDPQIHKLNQYKLPGMAVEEQCYRTSLIAGVLKLKFAQDTISGMGGNAALQLDGDERTLLTDAYDAMAEEIALTQKMTAGDGMGTLRMAGIDRDAIDEVGDPKTLEVWISPLETGAIETLVGKKKGAASDLAAAASAPRRRNWSASGMRQFVARKLTWLKSLRPGKAAASSNPYYEDDSGDDDAGPVDLDALGAGGAAAAAGDPPPPGATTGGGRRERAFVKKKESPRHGRKDSLVEVPLSPVAAAVPEEMTPGATGTGVIDKMAGKSEEPYAPGAALDADRVDASPDSSDAEGDDAGAGKGAAAGGSEDYVVRTEGDDQGAGVNPTYDQHPGDDAGASAVQDPGAIMVGRTASGAADSSVVVDGEIYVDAVAETTAEDADDEAVAADDAVPHHLASLPAPPADLTKTLKRGEGMEPAVVSLPPDAPLEDALAAAPAAEPAGRSRPSKPGPAVTPRRKGSAAASASGAGTSPVRALRESREAAARAKGAAGAADAPGQPPATPPGRVTGTFFAGLGQQLGDRQRREAELKKAAEAGTPAGTVPAPGAGGDSVA